MSSSAFTKGKYPHRYKVQYTEPLTDQQFKEGMLKGHFVRSPKHQGLVVFLHYSAARISEALSMTREQFRLTPNKLYCDIGLRLKGSKKVPPLSIPLDTLFVEYLVDSVVATGKGKPVWPYCRKTGYNIVHRVFHYPHYHRLSRITSFFQQHFTIPEVRSYTGLSLAALEYYVGLVSIEKMGEALPKRA